MTTEETLQRHERLLQNLLRQSMIPNANCYTIEECSHSIGVSIDTVKDYIKTGKLKCKYPNAKMCVRREDLDRYLQGMRPK